MVYSDKERDICPFCGGKLSKHKRFDYDQCEDCLTQIKSANCPETNQPYIYTDTPHHRKYVSAKLNTDPDNWYIERQVESSMYFRNITKIDPDGKIICPHCQTVHKT
jgi:reverse gyrase